MVIFAILIMLFVFVGVPISVVCLLDPYLVSDVFKKSPKYNVQDEMSFSNDAKWVEKVINSCNTLEQLYVCDELIKTLIKKYKNKVNPSDLSLIDEDLNSQWFLKSILI